MSQQTDKTFKDGTIINLDTVVGDTTPGFGVEANKQKTSQLGFRWLGAFDTRPMRPKGGDMIYNTVTRKLEIFVSQIYRGQLVPTITDPYIAGPGTYLEYLGELWYTEQGTGGIPMLPAAPLRERRNSIGYRSEQQSYFYDDTGILSRSIPTGVWTGLQSSVFSDINTTLPDTRSLAGCVIPYSGQFMAIGWATWETKPGDVKTELRLTKDTGFGPSQIAYNVHEMPVTTAVTTGTDSMGGVINATTTISLGSLDFVSQLVVRYGELQQGDVITSEVKHNAPGPLNMFASATFPLEEYQYGFTIIGL